MLRLLIYRKFCHMSTMFYSNYHMVMNPNTINCPIFTEGPEVGIGLKIYLVICLFQTSKPIIETL